MHDLDEDPVGWILEFSRGVLAVTALQLFCGIWTVFVIQSKLPHHRKLQVCLAMSSLLCGLSWFIFDMKTHLIGRVMGALALVFTTPLHVIASIERHETVKADRLSTILRIAVPAAIPSERHKAEEPVHQLVRGFIYVACVSKSVPFTMYAIEAGGILRDVCGLLFVMFGASGILNIMSGCMGLIGVRSPSPFRNPFLSSSMASFWSGRWNATVSDALRVGVYEPLVKRGYSKASSVMACFFISGIAHELILMYCGILNSRGEWLAFFLLNGTAVLIEQQTMSKMPGIVRRVTSFIVLSILFHFLFVPVTVRTGMAANGVQAMGAGAKLAEAFRKWVRT
ncbi:Membrane bound O-acyl transferase [Gracilaria domingensis]|nr:Membrane bound O-acyl transferase [Gracilaria domingensis]